MDKDLITTAKGLTERKEDELLFLHISPRENRSSILKHGLLTNRKPSGYGTCPRYKAVYFYHSNNVNVIYDLINKFKDFDVFEIRLDKLDTHHMIPDEDAQDSNKKVKSWQESLKTYGTAAIIKDVEPNKIKFMMNCNNKEEN